MPTSTWLGFRTLCDKGDLRCERKKKPYLRPICPTLKFAISPKRFESPPFGAFDMEIVWGSTVLGSWWRSFQTVVSFKIRVLALRSLVDIPAHRARQRSTSPLSSGGPCHPAREDGATWLVMFRCLCFGGVVSGKWYALLLAPLTYCHMFLGWEPSLRKRK